MLFSRRCILPTCHSQAHMAPRGPTGTQHLGKDPLQGTILDKMSSRACYFIDLVSFSVVDKLLMHM